MDFQDWVSEQRERGGDVQWGRIVSVVPWVLLMLVIVYLALNSFFTVDPSERAVVLRFGHYHTTEAPGLHFRIPLVDSVVMVSVQEHSLRLPFRGGGERPPMAREEESLMLTGDLNAASVEWTVQWQVVDPKAFFMAFSRMDSDFDEAIIPEVIRTASVAVMNRLVGDYSIDEVLTEKRGEIRESAREGLQKILDSYACGITIPDLQMQRVTPPESVKPAFDQVNASIQLQDQLENEANQERNRLLPAAEAQRDRLIREAEGYAARRQAETEGEISALRAKFLAYDKAPEETRQRLYIEAMEKVMAEVGSKIIIDADLQGILPLLPLQQGENQ